ncbi:hypothetical protein [Arthrobacter castelli]|uniref:hypothetical protein n=1 Tax=Arthrobacter castelli TaxID=271431 RepID=UPI0003F8B3D8|nr:hypothetical protein [Arthrobacter castelli]
MANDAAHPEPGHPESQWDRGPLPDTNQHPVDTPPPDPPADWFVLLDRIEAEVRQLEEHRQAWRALLSACDAGPTVSDASACSSPTVSGRTVSKPTVSGGSGSAWIGHLYFRSQALGVRRMVDGDRRAGSFKRLLGHLDSEVPRSDLRTLESSCNGIKRYVDQYVTHAQLDPDAAAPADADVDAAIDVLQQLLGKYTRLLRPGPRHAGDERL